MTPLQECIAECGVNAPLYTVPSDKWPEPMVVRYVRTYPNVKYCYEISIGGAIRLYSLHGHHYESDDYPDIAPVMPKPGERWQVTEGWIGKVRYIPDGRLAIEKKTGECWPIDRWGRCEFPKYSLILPYTNSSND